MNEPNERQQELKLHMRECRRYYEASLKLIETVDSEIAQMRIQHTRLFGPREMENAIREAMAHGMEIENCTFTMRKNSLFAAPSASHTTLIKAGDRFRLGDSPVIYQATNNDGLPSGLDKLILRIRRTIVATILHMETAKNDVFNSDDIDMDMADFKAAAQKAEAEFQASLVPRQCTRVDQLTSGKTSQMAIRRRRPKKNQIAPYLDVRGRSRCKSAQVSETEYISDRHACL